MDKGALLFKPGTIIMMFFIAIFGFVVFNWASDNVIDSVGDSGDQATQAIECSRLETELIDTVSSGNSTQVSYIINKDVEEVYVAAESSNGHTDTVTDDEPVAGELNFVNIDLADVSSVSISTPVCDGSLQ